jgi:predicted ATP-grasp superfamily ATP-dependent carboligase
MTSKLIEYREIQAQLADYQAKLKEMKPGVDSDLKIQAEIQAILDKSGKSVSYLLDLFGVASGKAVKVDAEKKTRRARLVKAYVNPHTGETVETKGGNNKTLKMWKDEHGGDVVEGWLKSA